MPEILPRRCEIDTNACEKDTRTPKILARASLGLACAPQILPCTSRELACTQLRLGRTPEILPRTPLGLARTQPGLGRTPEILSRAPLGLGCTSRIAACGQRKRQLVGRLRKRRRQATRIARARASRRYPESNPSRKMITSGDCRSTAPMSILPLTHASTPR